MLFDERDNLCRAQFRWYGNTKLVNFPEPQWEFVFAFYRGAQIIGADFREHA